MGRKQYDFEENDPCPKHGCEGILKYPKVENCSCHISPPCYNCVNNKLQCTNCYWEEGDDTNGS